MPVEMIRSLQAHDRWRWRAGGTRAMRAGGGKGRWIFLYSWKGAGQRIAPRPAQHTRQDRNVFCVGCVFRGHSGSPCGV